MKHFNKISRTMLLLMVLFSSLSAFAQKMVGDGFGGRAGYNPVNIIIGGSEGGIICSDKKLYLWGITQYSTNDGTLYASSTPKAVANVSNVRQASLGTYLNTYIKDDGTGYVFGRSTPNNTVMITNAYFTLAGGNDFVGFVKTDGTVWIGGNVTGTCQFFNGTPSTYCLVQVPGITNAKRLAYLAVDPSAEVMLLADGTVKTIGGHSNSYPASLISPSTPITVSGLSNIVDIKGSAKNFYALNSAGQVYSWGGSTAMGTGVADNGTFYLPQLITFPAGAAPIKAIFSGVNSGAALDENNNLYAWGYGSIGQGSTNFISSPLLVATNVRDVIAGAESFIYKNDNTLWGVGSGVTLMDLPTGVNYTTYTQVNPASVGLCAINSYNGMPPCVAGTTAPAVTPTTATNSCPTTTVDLTSLAISSSTPSGASLIWSTNKTPTSAGDTLTTAQKTAVSTAGKYYALYYDATNACYSPADSVTLTITTCVAPLSASNPAAQTATTGQAKTGNAATELNPTGGVSPYTYSNGAGDAACVAPSGATALTGLTVNSNGTYSYTAPATAGTYYYCIKVCDSATPTASCIVKTYTLTVTSPITVTNNCPSTTVNLMTAISATNLPSGASVTWHNGTPATAANQISNPTAVSIPGTYYMAYHDGLNNCYSLTSDAVIVTITTCSPDTDGDGIADDIDLDDDNDGILDTVEDAQLSADVDGDGIPNRLDLDSDNDGINDVIEAGGTDADKNGIADGVVNASGVPSSAGAGLSVPDTDGDTRPNAYDLDSDNDGINDLIESGNTALVDANGDGKVDGTDPDMDGILGAADATPSTFGDSNDPNPANTDGTDNPNYLDPDSDNDGITDLAESGITNVATIDANGDGKIDNPADADGDGIPQVVDGAPTVFGDANSPALPDANGNGIPDYIDAKDTDGDGIADASDLDDDNDGILDTVEDAQFSADVDGDGIPNRLDLDSDNDGINDVIEAGGTDADKNGIADGAVNASGIPSSAGAGLSVPDTDGDTRPNAYDLDSDNDGINDLIESGNTALVDANGDGKVDGTDPDMDGILGAADATPSTFGDSNDPIPANTDGTDNPNYLDPDSDNDGITDLAESGVTNLATIDANGDGKIDNPADADGDGIPQVVDGAPTVFGDANSPALPDANGNGIPDYIDAKDTDGDGIADASDLDDDNDGILDTVEDAQLSADVDGDGIPNRLDLDSDNDGINDVIEAGGTDADKNGIADGVVNASGVPSSAGAGLSVPDTDGDTRPNAYDLDSDNDGINDLIESGNTALVDANGDGKVDGTDPDMDGILGAADATPSTFGDSNDPNPANTDGTDNPNYLDPDSDNDGITDLAESGVTNLATIDANGDGKIDNPADADGDGIPQVVDGAPTVFGDANSPALPDANGNGIPDYIDAKDTDGDGIADASDLDDDNDGILDTVEDAQLSADVDGDGIPNRLDLDSDNDGINDVIEAGGTDADKNGIADGVVNASGVPSSAGAGLSVPDTDGDTRPNAYDLDSDNDGINDLIESGNTALVDANGDGKVDGTDPDMDGILGAADATPSTFGDSNDPIPANTDGTDNPNYLDPDSDNDGITDLAESGVTNVATIDANGDGKIDNPADADGDGIPQVVDGAPTMFGDANSPALPDANGNGIPDYIDANTINGVKVSVKAILQGAYSATTGLMRDDLRTKSLIPFNQPYNGTEYSDNAYSGTEMTTNAVLSVTGNDAIVDWVLVELRDKTTPSTVIAKKAGLIQRDGDVVDVDGVSPLTISVANDNYYVAIKHRNHLGVMTANAIALTSTSTAIDFTSTTLGNYKLTTALASDFAQKLSTDNKRMLWAGNVQKESNNSRVIYQGPNNEVSPVYIDVLTSLANTGLNANFILNGYFRSDVTMDGRSIYQGPGNEVDTIYFEVLTHVDNISILANYIINQQIP